MTSYTRQGSRMSCRVGVPQPSLRHSSPRWVTASFGGFASCNLLVRSVLLTMQNRVKAAVMPASFNSVLHSSLVLTSRPWRRHAPARQTRAGLPDAYRKIPMLPEHTWACLVVYAHEGQAWWRRYHSMLFGLPLAVSAFNRLPFLLQAAVRRCLAILCSFYFDDATAQDFDFCAVDSQSMLEECVSLWGYAFAEAKRQTPSSQGDFLGIVHDLQDSLLHGRIPLWICALVSSIRSVISWTQPRPTTRSLLDWPVSSLAAWVSSTRAPSARSLASGFEPSKSASVPQSVLISLMKLCDNLVSQFASS